MKRFFEFIKQRFLALLKLQDTPHSIAAGVAIGIFFGFTPLYGLKTLLVVCVAWVLQVNRVSGAISVNLHDVFLPAMPFILHWEYEIGYWVLSRFFHFADKVADASVHTGSWFQWETFVNVIWPTLLGSVPIGLPLTLISYFLTLRLVERYRATQRGESSEVSVS